MQAGHVINGRYVVEERLGNGAMGVVFRGTDQQSGDIIAIKTIRQDLLDQDPEIAKRFLREGRALAELDHPHIVTVLEAAQDGDDHFIVMEYVDGVTLSAQIQKYHQLPIKPTVQISYALASALAHIHERGIIHRDIKPTNIMFTAKGSPRLMDFGVAHVDGATPLTKPGSVLGTLSYVAPEVIYGQKATQQCDIWSLGMTMYKMLTGSLPFGGQTPAIVIAEILSQPLPDIILERDDIPLALAGLVAVMLEKEPAQRIDSMARVKSQLGTIRDSL